ncbi:extracellular solute-binding protein [Gracilibacillus oryzae]|uniref:Extracellular solute-binding protein n=1 Tax=Gracilibacillus oryzae TaxID=1672701 RepID=A0A7C8L383_9BACI|nr:extracellular solute-binding protein [Gracilibacillus oryzae]KAB8133652.1 extracellular solute-binding protein [Gracilibacillus oryzae]
MVRNFSKLFILILLAAFLAACVEKDPEETASTTEDGETVITLGRVTAANPKLPEGDTYEDNAYTRLVEKELNVDIRDAFEAEGEDYDRQVALAISSGDLPDMMRVNSLDELKELVENDLVADLTDVYDENASDHIKSIYESYDNRPLNEATFDGRLMAIPATIGGNAPNIVWIRKDWIDKLGIELDSDGDKLITLEELEKTASTFIENDPGGSGNPVGIPFVYWLNAGDYGGSAFAMTSIASVFDAHPRHYYENENGEIIYGSTSEETKKALGVMKEWFDKGIIDPQFGTRTWDDITALLTNGQTGIVTGPWHLPDWGLSAVKDMDKEAKFAAYTLKGENDKVNVFQENPVGQFIVVRKGYEHPELAVKILNLFYDDLANEKNIESEYPEIAKYNELGVDGSTRPFNIEVYSSTSQLDDFRKVESVVNGEIPMEEIVKPSIKADAQSIIDYIDNPENAETSSWSKYHSRMFGLGLIDELTKDNKFNWTTPFYVGTTETMEKKGANLLKLEEEDFIKIITGSESLGYFDTFVENWKSQGGNEILTEIEEEIEK